MPRLQKVHRASKSRIHPGELLRIQHPFDVDQAVEETLPELEAQIEEALKPPKGAEARFLEPGRLVNAKPGIVVSEERARDRKESRKWEADPPAATNTPTNPRRRQKCRPNGASPRG